ncbi:MAG: carbohydrate kinase family protein [Armatimonadetes bacterium]|nr:carbohydrate kinase family protein [Armatimonadota bacterium]
MPDIVVAGHICLDIIPDIPASAGELNPGKLVEVGPATLSTGGAVSNVGIALHKLGAKVRLVGKVGDDDFGNIVVRILESHGSTLSERMAVVRGERTSYSVVISRPAKDRTFLHFPGANDTFSASDVSDEALEGAGLFHFGYPPIMRRFYEDRGTELERLFRRARAKGLTTSLDLSLPDPNSDAGRADWPSILSRVLPHVQLFVPSVDELAFMLREEVRSASLNQLETLERLSAWCLGRGASVVVLKCGADGLYLRSGRISSENCFGPSDLWENRQLLAPCWDVEVAGTTGAGDTTVAGFLHRLDGGPVDALALGQLTGACCVQSPDAVSGVMPEAEAKRESGAWRLKEFPFPDERARWRWHGPVWAGPEDA